MPMDLTTALADLLEDEALKIAQERLAAGDDPHAILKDAGRAMEIVGRLFEKGEYFIPDLVYSAEILQGITGIIAPNLTVAAEDKYLGKIVVGTVAGDIHDIGKNVVALMLNVNGFEVHDLGVDVAAERFVEKVRELQPQVVGLSGLLTLAFDPMKRTIEAIAAAGLRDHVKIMIGGAQVDDGVRKYTGADAYGPDAVSAVSLAKEWVERRQGWERP